MMQPKASRSEGPAALLPRGDVRHWRMAHVQAAAPVTLRVVGARPPAREQPVAVRGGNRARTARAWAWEVPRSRCPMSMRSWSGRLAAPRRSAEMDFLPPPVLAGQRKGVAEMDFLPPPVLVPCTRAAAER